VNRRSSLFGRMRIIRTVFRPNMNRIRIFALNFKAVSLSFIIININIDILDIHSHSARDQFISVNLKYICTHKVIKLAKNCY